MALNKIKTASITDDAVNADKLAAGSVTNSELNKTAITSQTELAEEANDADYTIIYDTSSTSLKKILRSNIKQSGPTVSSVSPTNANEKDATTSFTITGSGFTAGTTARLIGNGGQVVEFTTVTRTSTTSITAVTTNTNLSNSDEPYDVQVTNGEGFTSLLTNQINFNASPTYVTAAGSLRTVYDSARTGVRITVNATDPESAGNVTFEKQSGVFPPGLALTNEGSEGGTGVISGNATAVGSDTTSNFTLRAVDAASNTTSRAFSITVKQPQYSSFTSSGTFAVPTGNTSLTAVLVVAGGGGSGFPGCRGGAGAGGLIYMPVYKVSPAGTLTVTVGDGGAGNANGQDSVLGSPGDPGLGQGGVLTAKGGGKGGNPCNTGEPGGSGGGTGRDGHPGDSATVSGGTALQPTQPGNSGAYGFGSAGGQSFGHGWRASAGGGGAGAVGGNGPGSDGNPSQGDLGPAGSGGVGKSYTIADGTTGVYYAGGGGGAIANKPGSPGSAGSGGQGGGGNGGSNACSPTGAQNGTANKGGGAGGAKGSGCGSSGAMSGGKGVVIISY